MEQLIIGGYAKNYVLVYSDIKNFRFFNQKYGYSNGDQLLQDFCNDVATKLDVGDFSYFTRISADRFALFFPYENDAKSLARITDEFNQEFCRRQRCKFPEMDFRVRSGIYFVEPGCSGASAAIDAANDARMHIDDLSKRTALVYSAEMIRQHRYKDELLNGMNRFMERGQFHVYLQPIFSLDDRSIIGAEALTRLILDDGELVPPDVFIPLYEQTGRIVELDYYVLDRVAKFLAENQRLGRRQIPVSVNLSAHHASYPDTVDRMMAILQAHKADPHLLHIELTETAMLSNYKNVQTFFRQMKEQGIGALMYDFGITHSLLNVMIDIPVKTLKLDHRFFQRCVADDRGRYLLEQVVHTIHGLDCRIICEGIETEEQAAYMNSIGCKIGQGFLVSKPIPMEEFIKTYL